MIDPGTQFVVGVAIVTDGTATKVDMLVNGLIRQLKIAPLFVVGHTVEARRASGFVTRRAPLVNMHFETMCNTEVAH